MEATAVNGVKKKKRKKIVLVVSAVLVAVIVLLLLIARFVGPSAGSDGSAGFANTTVRTGDISTAISVNGNIENNIIDIVVPYDVTVSDIKVEEGDYVSKGDELITLSSSSLQDKIDDVKEEIEEINNKIDDQSGNEENIKALKERKSELSAINKSLTEIAKKNAVYASGNGIVDAVNVTESSKIYKNDESDTISDDSDSEKESSTETSSMTLTPLEDEYFGLALTIDSNDTVSIEAEVDELDIADVEKGQDVDITFDAIPDEEYKGEVKNLNNDISIENGIVKYSVLIELEKSEDMKIGMSANATIIKEAKENVLLIQADAIQENAEGLFVYTTLEGDKLGGMAEITTGLSDETYVEVISGLSEGDTVYYVMANSENSDTRMIMRRNRQEEGNMMPGGNGPSGGSSGNGPQRENSGGSQDPSRQNS